MDTILALNEVTGFLNISKPKPDDPTAIPFDNILLSGAVLFSFVAGIMACIWIIKTVHSTYLPICQIFDCVLHWSILSICYLTISVFVFNYRTIIEPRGSARRFEAIFSFNTALVISLLTFDFCTKKRFSTIAFSGYVYLIVAWSIISVAIHDLAMVFQLAQVLLHCLLLFMIPIMWMQTKKKVEPFYVFRLKILYAYTMVWVLKNILLSIFCFWLRCDFVTVLASCNVFCTFLTSVIITRIVHVTCYTTSNTYLGDINGEIQLLSGNEITNA